MEEGADLTNQEGVYDRYRNLLPAKKENNVEKLYVCLNAAERTNRISMKINQQNNWKTTSVKQVYDNAWVTVEHREVVNPAGKPGIYGVVRFKNRAIGIVPLDDEGYIYLVGQYRYTLDAYSWEIPEGGGPLGEDPLDTAKRELKEETGLVATDWKQIGRIHTSNSVTDEEGFIFLAEGLIQQIAEPEETEELHVRRVLLGEAVDMVMRSEITDSLSMCAILMVARMLQTR